MRQSFDYFTPEGKRLRLKQLRASCYPANQTGLPVEKLDRLFDLDSEPQRDDYKAVLECAPRLRRPLDRWLEARLGADKWTTWLLKDMQEMADEFPERMADAKFRAAQISNRSDADKLKFAMSLVTQRTETPATPPQSTAPATPERAPATVATEVPDALIHDRETERLTGKVTAAILCADYGISPSHLSRLLNRWHHGEKGHDLHEISTTAAQRLTRTDVAKVRARLEVWAQKQAQKREKCGIPAFSPSRQTTGD